MTREYVYVIRNGQLIKIGRTTNPKRRMQQLKPDQILRMVEVSNSHKIERELHQQFKRHRLPQSEYFRISGADACNALDFRADARRTFLDLWPLALVLLLAFLLNLPR